MTLLLSATKKKKKSMVGGEEKAPQIHRPSLKSRNVYPNWKHNLRENCLKRVREDRGRLLWKLRLSNVEFASTNHQKLIKSSLKDIFADELKKIKVSSLPEKLGDPDVDARTDDMVWDYDMLSTNHQGEYEEMLLIMQNIFYEDLRTEETRKECLTESWEDEEDEYLARALYEHMQLNGEQVEEVVWCPICKQGRLQESAHHISCSHCKVKLTQGDEVNSNLLRQRLSEAHAEHLDRGCRQRPEFCCEAKFNLTALYIKCKSCNTFEVVL